jgi:hypothetical protein
MSRGSKTITGEDTLEVDELNIVGDGIGINGNFGQAGQVIKKSAIDNSINWDDEQQFTAVLPIILTGGQISFDSSSAGSNKVVIKTANSEKTLHIGNTITLQENSGLILGSILDISEVNLLNSGVIDIFTDLGTTRKLTISKDSIIPTDSNTTYIIGNSANPINQITSNIYHTKTTGFFGDLAGDFLTISGTSISGNTNAHITGFKSFTLQSGDDTDATKTINSNGNTITTHGGKLLTYGGNIDLIKVIVDEPTEYGNILNFGDIVGNGTSAILGIQSISTSNGGPVIDDDFIDMNQHPINDCSVVNTGDIQTSSITATGLIASTGNITLTGTGSNGIITTANTAIFSAGIKQAIGGGNFSITSNGTIEVAGGIFTGDIDMDDNKIENVILRDPTIDGNLDLDDNNIENVGGISMSGNFDLDDNNIENVGGISMTTNTGDIDMNNSDIVACNTITCSTLNLSGQISSGNLPTTITGNKTFTGNTTFSAGMGANIDMNQYDLTNTGNITTTTGKITSSGDILANGNIVGDNNTEITGCKFVDFNNWYIPADCYIGTSSRTDMTQQHLVKYILPINFLPDDDNSDNRYTISDVNSGAGRNMGTSTQLYTQFTIPAGYKWVGYTVWITNSSRIVYTGSGVLSFHSKPMIRTNFFQNQFLDTPFNTTNFSSSPITYGFTNGTFHYLTDQPSSGWDNSFNTNSATGITTGQIMVLRSSGLTNAYYIQGAEAYFFKDT